LSQGSGSLHLHILDHPYRSKRRLDGEIHLLGFDQGIEVKETQAKNTCLFPQARFFMNGIQEK
jgi:hypothetical protein